MSASSEPLTRAACTALDAADPLAPLREQFVHPPGVIYLDGNSLGLQPVAAAARVAQVLHQEWGQGLIRSWNSAGWISLPQRVGDKIAQLIGAGPGEVVVADSTSVNLFKVLSAALALAGDAATGRDSLASPPRFMGAANPTSAQNTTNPITPPSTPSPTNATNPPRRVIVSERGNFPTDLYIAESLARQHGGRLELLQADDIPARLAGTRGHDVAVLTLTHVDFRSGRVHDMAALSRLAHEAGALAVWDLAHSAGALPVDLHAADADFAVGCGYKYLNGGPGAPAFVWAHPRHVNRAWQPLAGWIGHAAPFEFTPNYHPAVGIDRYLCGTPPILSLAALECGVDTVLAAQPLGGMTALRTKSLALTRLFADLVAQRCAGHGFEVITPLDDDGVSAPPTPIGSAPAPLAGREGMRRPGVFLRGSQIALRRTEGAFAIVQALIERGVIGDFRAPDVLRFGFTPLTLRFADVWDAVEQLREVMDSGQWRDARFHRANKVT
jgi:kynureninase